MSYRVFDLETNTKELFKRKASPWHPDNRVVAYAYKDKNGPVKGKYYPKGDRGYAFDSVPPEVKILVGHNIKFDLLWTWGQDALMEFLMRGGIIWCTQYAYYLLNGQQEFAQMVAMDDIIEEYGGTLKNDQVKELWKAGVNTEDINEDMLMEYLCGTEYMKQFPEFAFDPETDEELKGDILNTELIFRKQFNDIKKAGMLPAVLERMEGLLATVMMEYNGIFVDKELGITEAGKLSRRIQALDVDLLEYIPEDKPDEVEFKWGNRYHLSPLLFGGQIKYEKWTQHVDDDGNPLYAMKDEEHYLLVDGGSISVDEYKAMHSDGSLSHNLSDEHLQKFKAGKNAGEFKTKKVKVPDLDKPKGARKEYLWKLPGFTKPDPAWKSATEGLYSVAGDIIEELGQRNIPFLQALAERATLAKDLGTYYITEDPKTGDFKGMLTLIGDDGIIHHSINHSLTVTTRLSSSSPKQLGL